MPQAVQLAKAVIAAVDEKIPQDQLKETRKAVSVQTLSHSIPHCSIEWREGVLRLVSFFFKFSLNTEWILINLKFWINWQSLSFLIGSFLKSNETLVEEGNYKELYDNFI